MIVYGCDPGVNGGFCLLDDLGPIVVPFRPKMTENDLLKTLPSANFSGFPRICFFEKVGYRPHDGGKGAFTFGRIVGLLRGVLLARGFELRDVAPVVWQSKLGCLSGGNKNVTKEAAKKLFPTLKITHNTADALLIAYYGKLMLEGK